MGYFPVRYDSRVVIYEHKIFIRLAADNVTFFAHITVCLMGFEQAVVSIIRYGHNKVNHDSLLTFEFGE